MWNHQDVSNRFTRKNKKITKHQIKQPNAGTISILLRKSLIFNSIYDFTLENKWPNLEIKYNILEHNDEYDDTLSLEQQEKQYITNIIKRFTHNKQIDIISEFVEDRYQKSTTFVKKGGEEMLHLICAVIMKFENK